MQASLIANFIGVLFSARAKGPVRVRAAMVSALAPLAVVLAMASSPHVVPHAGSTPRWDAIGGGALAPPLLVALCVVVRFADGYYTPLFYAHVGDPFPGAAARGEVIRYTGSVAIVVAMVGVWITFALVEARALEE